MHDTNDTEKSKTEIGAILENQECEVTACRQENLKAGKYGIQINLIF